MKDVIQITVNWDSATSIKLAEQMKAKLENKGYSLINQFGGITYSVLIYALHSSISANKQE